MFSYNKNIYGVLNFVFSFFIFNIIFFIRYNSSFFPNLHGRELNLETQLMFVAYTTVIVIMFVGMKLYELNKITSLKNSFFHALLVSLFSSLLFGLYFYLTKADFARFVFFIGMLFTPFILIVLNKLVYFILYPRSKRWKMYYIGESKKFPILIRLFKNHDSCLIVDIQKTTTKDLATIPQDVILIIDELRIFNDEELACISKHELQGGMIYTINDLFDYFDESIPSEIVTMQNFHDFSSYKINSFYSTYTKRLGDILISTALLIMLSPLLLLTALLIKLTSKGPVFYTQKRVGLYGKEFYMFKFRTMKLDAEQGEAVLAKKNDSRVTFMGKIIRPIRIDELPQLVNIFIGDMSFIGPRPEREEIIKKILKQHPIFNKRLIVKPGLTGWAQVKHAYVNEIDAMNTKLDYDLYYIKHISLMFDLKIILYTIETILFRRGAI